MIIKLPESTDSVLGFWIDGEVSAALEDEWIQVIEEHLDREPKLRILVVLADHAHWGVKAGYKDLAWALKHMDRLDKIAIVSHRKVWAWLVAMDSPFAGLFGIGEKHFDQDHLKEAWAWVKS